MKSRTQPKNNGDPRYSLMINWSPDDNAFIVCVPELGHGAKTHGRTLAEAMEMAKDLIATLVDLKTQRGEVIPSPLTFDARANFAPDVFAELPALRGEIKKFETWSDEQRIKVTKRSKTRLSA